MIKKLSLLAFCVLFLNAAYAQEPLTKKGTPVLPHKGDWGIGFDVVPIIRYAGNLFHETDNNQDLSAIPLTISARYFHRDNKALRIYFRNQVTSMKSDTLVPKIGSTNNNEQVADETVETISSTILGLGVEKWRGTGRLRGVYGIEGYFVLATDKISYSYGNPLSSENTVQERTKSQTAGTTWGLGLRGFLGVEYFIAPKISLSAEFGYGPFLSNRGAQTLETESFNGSSVDTQTTTVKGKTSTFTLSTDSNSGSISLLFYF